MTLGPALPWRAGEVSAGVSGEHRRHGDDYENQGRENQGRENQGRENHLF